jgi:hypothetical protein
MKKFVALLLVVASLVTVLTGCTMLEKVFLFDKTNETEVSIGSSGDKFEFLITKDSGYTMTQNKNTRHYEVKDANGTIVLTLVFYAESDLRSAIDSKRFDYQSQSRNTTSHFIYTLHKHKQSKTNMMFTGYLIGSNTGFIGLTTTTNQSAALDVFNHMSFNIISTKQTDANYYPNYIK